MSKISRRQVQNKKRMDATRKNSMDCKDVMRAKYVRNLAMMEDIIMTQGTEEEVDNEEEEGSVTSEGENRSSRRLSLGSLMSSEDGEGGQEGQLEKSTTGPTKSPNSHNKEVNHDYIRACLASGEEQKKKQAEREQRKRARAAERKELENKRYSKGSSKSDGDGSVDDDDWLDGAEFTTNMKQVGVVDYTKQFRRDSINSFQHIEDAGDRSLCSTEDGDSLDQTILDKTFTFLYKKIQQLEQYENINRLVAIVLFYVVGVVVYSYLESWSVSDTVYFITISITTVGFGDLVPTNDISKLFTMLYVLLGLVVIFSYVNTFAENMLLYAENQAVKLAERAHKRKLQRADSGTSDVTSNVEGIPYAKYRRKIIFYLLLVVVTIFAGSVFYMYNEDWTFVNALYFSFIATMTIGYGDPVLQNPSSRTFSIFYVFFSVVVIAMALGNIGAIKLTIRQEKKKFEMLNKKLDLNSIIAMDDNGDGVDRIEFLTAMLMQMNGLSKEEDIDPWLKRFDQLDKDGSGRLDQEDLRLFAEEEEIRKETRREVRRLLEQKQHMAGMFSQVVRSGSVRHIFVSDSEEDEDIMEVISPRSDDQERSLEQSLERSLEQGLEQGLEQSTEQSEKQNNVADEDHNDDDAKKKITLEISTVSVAESLV
mmetsp:Transcript_19060/g.35522  ORF Transcript_19060/g.35522 Transcript_19060/m.35522 type:complete len:650 (-) Transcript_19060:61-2010(-)|eukprot:CAMPEP_0114432036 /NCGR_PEP_ID=MMETSP0103-20121206/10936_1 /TAXON_ID=37642 ORGANISM="Paraphysomonas imperforata, Strain PA2" /NCGR_SAMPLE_ID=MMETSP0103 /ASSEMBLY_ACC=CAM_ASM_000201 /LENGTH=649 /DNA_ID=CAMNT_0001601675 /DNA_START=78 /DNA_END=2027 /DNA_ORIENTATION=-